ncbi:RloB domain-containing protein [Candidatus Woesearchaeota archaeon]|nr:RloB domain-containing protein [Candidatus Woesearchaeota archaeon]
MVRRRPTTLKKTSKLWISCEGKTEKRYFENLRVTEKLRLKIVPLEAGVTRADQILDKALRFQNGEFKINKDSFDSERDIIVCVFDRDDNNTADVFETIRSKMGEIKIIYSNPCFEFWILCHDGYYNSPAYDQRQVCDLVTEKLGLQTKTETELYEKTKEKIEDAKTHAKRIKKVHEDAGTELISRDSTPLSLAYEIIEIIDEFR